MRHDVAAIVAMQLPLTHWSAVHASASALHVVPLVAGVATQLPFAGSQLPVPHPLSNASQCVVPAAPHEQSLATPAQTPAALQASSTVHALPSLHNTPAVTDHAVALVPGTQASHGLLGFFVPSG